MSNCNHSYKIEDRGTTTCGDCGETLDNIPRLSVGLWKQLDIVKYPPRYMYVPPDAISFTHEDHNSDMTEEMIKKIEAEAEIEKGIEILNKIQYRVEILRRGKGKRLKT